VERGFGGVGGCGGVGVWTSQSKDGWKEKSGPKNDCGRLQTERGKNRQGGNQWEFRRSRARQERGSESVKDEQVAMRRKQISAGPRPRMKKYTVGGGDKKDFTQRGKIVGMGGKAMAPWYQNKTNTERHCRVNGKARLNHQ